MPSTIAHLLADEHLGLTLLTEGVGTDREVLWAHTSELVDPSPWLKGGELLMTLGIALPTEGPACDAYVARLAAVGIAGLAVDTGIVLGEVPADIVAAGERHGLIVLRVPPATPFLAISRKIISAITADEVASVTEVSRRQDRIAAAGLRSGAGGVVQTLAPLLGADVVLLTARGAVLEAAGSGSAGLRERVVARLGDRRGRGAPALTFTHVDDDGVVTATAVGADPGSAAILALGSDRPLSSHERLVVGHAAAVLALLLRTPERIRHVEARLRRAVGEGVLGGSVPPDPEVARLLGLRADTPLVVAVFRLDTEAEAEAVALVERFLLAKRTAYLLGVRPHAGVGVVVPARGAGELVLQLCRTLDARLPDRVVAGISSPVGLDEVAAGLAQAMAAARAALAKRSEVTEFVDLGPVDILVRSQPVEVLRAMSDTLLGDLAGSGSAQRADLLRTLTVYLERGGQVEAAAQGLGIHRHTLRQRLQRIEQLVGGQLDDPRLRADLWFALRARRHLDECAGGDAAAEGARDARPRQR